jgi:hypothetical protein
MNYAIIEIVIYLAWTAVFATRLRDKSDAATEELVVFLFALPCSTVMELVNQYVVRRLGAYYPGSLFFFPLFKFPVGVILITSLYAWAVYVVSRLIVRRIAPRGPALDALLKLVLYLLVLSSSVLFEAAGVGIGYWRYYVPPPPTVSVWFSEYLYYLCFAFPAAVVAALVSWRLAQRTLGRVPADTT